MRFTRFLAIFLIIGGGAALWFSFRQQRAQYNLPTGLEAHPGASVIVVTLDTTRQDRFGCYGSPAGVTPFMDSLAEQGIVFENAQAVAPITLPSHTSIFTGLYPQNHGVRNNGMFTVPEDVESLAEVYAREGYATGAFISAEVLNRKYGLNKGFDVFDDDLTRSRKLGRSAVPARRGNQTLASALQWLAGIDADQPVFMWLHLYDPHAPYDPPPEFREKFPSDPYTGEIAFVDSLVEQLVDDLKASGRFDNTILSILADHGEGLGEHGERTHGMLLHQATIHIPWILVTPDKQTRGLRIKAPVSNADVSPTLAALTGVTPPNASRSDGRVAIDPDVLRTDRDLYFEALLPMYQYGWSPLRGMRNGPWQLVSGRHDELFNLTNDPRELTDVASSEELQTQHLKDKITAIIEADKTLVNNPAMEMRPGEREALEALGYVVSASADRRDPPDPRNLVEGHVAVEIARELLSAGRYDEALAQLDLMLKDDRENLAALNLKGNVLLQLGDIDGAEEIYMRSLELDPKSSDSVAALCRLEMGRHNYDKAIELARLGRTTRSPFRIFDALEARCLMALGRNDEAVALVEEALLQSPDDPDLLVFHATTRIAAGDVETAEEELRRANDADPFHSGARQALGQLLENSGREEEAIEVYKALLEINPGEINALLRIGTITMASDPEAAIPYLEEATRLAPGRKIPVGTLGIAYLQAGRQAEAEAALKRALAIEPGDPMLLNNLGILLVQQGKPEEAIPSFESLVEQHPDFIQAYNNAAIALAETGRDNEAEKMIRRALARDGDFLDAWLTLATLQHRHAEFADEYQSLTRAYELSQQRLDVGLRLAAAAAATGNCRQTLQLMGNMPVGTPVPPNAELGWATCLEDSGDFKRALVHYEDVARRTPQGPLRDRANEAIQRLSLKLQDQ